MALNKLNSLNSLNKINGPKGGGVSGSSSWLLLTPMPLVAYGSSETTVDLSVTDVFSGSAKLSWYKSSNNGVSYTKITTTSRGVLTAQATGLTTGTNYLFKVRAEKGSQHSFWSNVVSVPTWCAKYRAIYNAVYGTKPSARIASAQNKAVWYWSGNNSDVLDVLSQLSCLILPISGMSSDSDALLWWTDPTKRGTLGGASAPTRIDQQGFVGTGSGYIDTGFNPSSDSAGLYTQDDASAGWFFYNDRYTSQLYGNGCKAADSSHGTGIYPQYTNKLYAMLNSASNTYLTYSNKSSSYLFSLIRVGNTGFEVYQGTNDLGTITSPSSTPQNATMLLLANRSGASITDYSQDTISGFYAGKSLSSTAIKVLNDGLGQMIMDMATPAISFYDTCDGVAIDTSKWTVTNPNTWVTFQKNIMNNMYEMHFSQESVGTTTYYNNSLTPKTQPRFGVYRFTLMNLIPFLPSEGNHNLLGFSHGSGTTFFESLGLLSETGKQTISLCYNGTPITSDIIEDFGMFKMVYYQLGKFQLFHWFNDAWVQVGTDQHLPIGQITWLLATQGYGYFLQKMGFRDVYVTNYDYDSLFPVQNTFTSGVDIRTGGAVPDNATDCIGVINAMFAAGSDVRIQDGEFMINSTLSIPSNRRLYIQNGKLSLKYGVVDCFIRNSDFDNGNVNIGIIGSKVAVLNGGGNNNFDTGHSKWGVMRYTNPTNWHAINMPFCQVNGLTLTGLFIIDQPYIGTYLQKCSNFSIENIYTAQIISSPGASGFDLGIGTNNGHLLNVETATEDDCTTIWDCKHPDFCIPTVTNWDVGDTHDIDFYNVKAAQGHLCQILGERDNNLYNITIRSCRQFRTSGVSVSPINIGLDGYSANESTYSSMHDISITDLVVDQCGANDGVIEIWNPCSNVTVTMTNNSGKPDCYVTKSKDVRNVIVNSVVYPIPAVVSATVENATKNQIDVIFDLEIDEAKIPDVSAFTCSPAKTCTSIVVSGTRVSKIYNSNFTDTDVITESYVKPGTNPLTGIDAGSSDAGVAASYTGISITNNILSTYPTVGLLGRWRYNGDATDSSGNGNDETNSNGVLIADKDAVANHAYSLVPASNAWLSKDPFVASHVDEFTISVWFKANALVNLMLFADNTDIASYARGWGIMWVSSGTKLRFFVNSWSTNYVETVFNDITSWHHVICSYKKTGAAGNQIRMMLDGGSILYGTDYSAAMVWTACIFGTGKFYGPAYGNQYVDEKAFWNKELSDAQFLQVFNAGVNP